MFHQDNKTAYINSHWNKKIYRFDRPPNRDFINEKGGLDEDEDDDDDDDHLIYKFKLKMANTLSVMTNVLRNVVSKKRIRYKENGFDLDLAYISDNIIAMGYPADNLESIYRNRLEDVYKFLEEHHQDHYRIYNLCLERSYDKNKFHGRVAVYPFEDHNPPTIELIQKFCNDVDTWLGADTKNVAAVHCKAGKGRTGTMICCYLLYSGQHGTPEEALAYYDSKRTKDRKGVTIPSQRRYVQYFSKLLQSQKSYEKCTLQFCEIRFMESHILHNHGTVNCTISVLQDTPHAVRVENLQSFCMDFRKCLTLDLRNSGLDVTGDIKIELSSKPARKKIFHFWFNTYFILSAAETEGEDDDERYVYTLNKWEIDDVHKDKEHKCYPENFKVQLVFYKNAVSNRNQQTTNAVSGNRTSSSSSNYEFTHMGGNMETGGRMFMAHNSYPLTTAVSCAVSPIALSSSTQLNNSGSNLSYNCDQKSSSSSASVSSLVGGSGGSGSESTKNNKMTSNGNADLKLNQLSFPPSSNAHQQRTVSGHFNENMGADLLVQPTLSIDYSNFSTVNNIKHKLLQQHQSNQQQQQEELLQYQPSGNNVAAIPPSKVSRGNKNKNYKASSSANHGGFDGYVVGSGNVGSNNVNSIKNHSTNNGLLHAYANDIIENDHDDEDFDYDVDRRDAAAIEDDDDDAEEDWESGESSALSLPHLKDTFNNDTTLDTTFHKTTPLLPHASPTTSTITTATTTTVTTPTTRTIKKKFSDTSNLQELTVYSSMNSAPLTNTSTSSSCSLSSKSDLGGENDDGNDCIRKTVNETGDGDGDGGDDDNNEQKVHSEVDQIPNGNAAIMKRNSEIGGGDNTNAFAVVSPVPRNKFFSFALAKTRTLSHKSTPESNVTTTVVSVQNKPFFRRKSFKAAKSSNFATGDIAYSSSNNDPTTSVGWGCAGLAPSSKQKLKIKLKRNRFKLAQQFQKLHAYLRSDPDDFCESLAKQTMVRRNSNCSLNGKNNKTAITNSAKVVIQPKTGINNKLSTSPGGCSLSASKSPNCLSPSSLEHLATQSSLSFSTSNASLGGSSVDCDLEGCDCNDYYSSICDNQLSFENSPCKSPRSLADIALMSGSSCSAQQNPLTSSLQHRGAPMCPCTHSQQNNLQNNTRLPFLVNIKNSVAASYPHISKDPNKFRKQDISQDIVVVAAKPAKTDAIGFNVTLPIEKEEMASTEDCFDVLTKNSNPEQAHTTLNRDAINGFVIGAYECATNRENIDEKEADSSGTYLTPPTSESVSVEQEVFDSCSSNEASTNSSTGTPFIFPKIINEITAIEGTIETPIHQSTRPLNLLILKKNSTNFTVDGTTRSNTNKVPSPDNASLESMENNDDSSVASVSNGNNTAGTGTSSSGFSTSECCSKSSNNPNGICDCNPLLLDLERYEVSRASAPQKSSLLTEEENIEQEIDSKSEAEKEKHRE